jgi:hypothetical protein
MKGEDLDRTYTTIQIVLKEIMYPNGPGKYMVVDYSSSWDKYSYTASLSVKDKSKGKLLKWSQYHIEDYHRFKAGDNYVILNLNKKVEAEYDGKKQQGFAGTAGISNGIRVLDGTIFCVAAE